MVISDLVRARPRPVPCVVLENWLSTCSNGLARRARSSLAMPMPVSVTDTLTMSPNGSRRISALTVTLPARGVNLMAFDSRFSSTCLTAR